MTLKTIRNKAIFRITNGSLLMIFILSVAATLAHAQGQAPQHVVLVVPDTSVEHTEDIGMRAHTNHLILVRPDFTGTSPTGETPQSIRPVYELPSVGGTNVIAIVDAYDYPTAENDLGVFSQQFGLLACTTANGCFSKVYASGIKPPSKTNTCGWGQEAALDIEWAHAIAPNAKIILVEAKSNSFSDLFQAVDVASKLVSQNGSGEVSMSWGGSEFSAEYAYDSHFTTSGVVYFAASGDTGGKTIYPSASPNVVAAGGTTIHRDPNNNNAFLSETGWSGSGGGPSVYEKQPSFQSGVVAGSQRGVPDFSFDADPNSGVSVYDSITCQGLSGWMVFGGTSVASPSLAGIVNLAGAAGGFYSNSNAELTTIYQNMTNSSDFRDITSGTAGSYTAGPGWDYVTGIGSDQGLSGK
jgi:kumamolisin